MKLLLFLIILALANGKHEKRVKAFTRYAFFRTMERERDMKESRRVFGGELADLSDFPAMAALMDQYWTTRCSGSVITPYWALTAAHCVTSRVAYIRYNSRHPTSPLGDSAHVLYLYRHPKIPSDPVRRKEWIKRTGRTNWTKPKYARICAKHFSWDSWRNTIKGSFKVVQEDEGRGMDVTLLHHDLGLIRTRDQMILQTPMHPLKDMTLYNPTEIENEQVSVLGYGKTNYVRSGGENLYAVKLKMINCDRGSWFHCICGMASPGQEQRGVCSGDSGGPVVYRNVQVGVTSMGPVECMSIRAAPPEGATSVFTSTFHYVDLINATITDAEKEITRSRVTSPPVPFKETHRNSVSAMILRIHIPIVLFSVFARLL